MKNTIIIFISLALFYSCNQQENVSEQKDSEIKLAVDTLLNNWHKDAAQANYENYFNFMDSISVYIGTDVTENWTKNQFQEFSKPHFEKGKAWDFKPLERNVYVSKTKNVVWFDELLYTWMGTCRGSGVLEKSNNAWKLKHYVLSIPIPNDNVKAVIEVKTKSDSAFLSGFNK